MLQLLFMPMGRHAVGTLICIIVFKERLYEKSFERKKRAAFRA